MAVPLNSGGVALPALPQSTAITGVQSGSANKASGKAAGELPFAELVRGLIQDTSDKQGAVNENVKQVVSGETDSINDVVLTASRADLAFRLVMEIRNRLISSYQEIMRMQV